MIREMRLAVLLTGLAALGLVIVVQLEQIRSDGLHPARMVEMPERRG
jgi:hypothetical protein